MRRSVALASITPERQSRAPRPSQSPQPLHQPASTGATRYDSQRARKQAEDLATEACALVTDENGELDLEQLEVCQELSSYIVQPEEHSY